MEEGFGNHYKVFVIGNKTNKERIWDIRKLE